MGVIPLPGSTDRQLYHNDGSENRVMARLGDCTYGSMAPPGGQNMEQVGLHLNYRVMNEIHSHHFKSNV